MTKYEDVKFALHFIGPKSFTRPEVAAAGVVDQNIETTGLGQRGVESAFDRGGIGKIELHRMKSWQLWQPCRITRSPPYFVTALSERLCDRRANAGTGPGEKDLFHLDLTRTE